MNNKYEALEKLQSLLEKGILTEEEFKKEKEKLLADAKPLTISETKDFFGLEENTYAMLIHLAATATIFYFFIGAVSAFLLWVTHKDKYINIDNHGRIVLNWLLTFIVVLVALVVVLFILDLCGFFTISSPSFPSSPYQVRHISYVGFVFLFFLLYMILNIIQSIVGAIKAKSGKLWRYPLSIPFIKMRK